MIPMSSSVYPLAIQKPLTGHSVPGTLAQRNTVVLHITQGSTMEGAYQTFSTSVTPKRVSAHFIIDRDGKVYQLLPTSDTAWHASQSNFYSVGVEHVAKAGTLLCTEEQYQASAALVKWLCSQMGISCDRNHIREHCEASPRDGHVLCCHGALDPNRVVKLAQGLPS